MDFLDFEGQDLYFDEPLSGEAENLLKDAAEAYPHEQAEALLLRCYFLEPEHLSVLVAMYRYYYYRHRYEDAVTVAERTLLVAGNRLGIHHSWQHLTEADLARAVGHSMGLTRFYLLALKATAYLRFRLGEIAIAAEGLDKLSRLDPKDQFGAAFLQQMARDHLPAQAAASDSPSATQPPEHQALSG